MTHPTYYDDSLPEFAALVAEQWGRQAIENNLFLRDASGRLTLVILDSEHSQDDRTSLASKAVQALGPYVDRDGFAVATPDELFDDSIKTLVSAQKLPLQHARFVGDVYLVDRRVVGADWLRSPARSSAPPTHIVFASLKGGVGRSTALCVLAAHLAARGRRVLAIDMDLEAPGLGNMLLPGKTLPEFGLLDWLVERGVGPIDDQFCVEMVGPSWLGGGHGRVDVIPAIGRRSLANPANVLSKLARAYLSGSDGDGESSSFADHMRTVVGRFADPARYDAILIDSRAGLHETTAAAVLGLGANVIFFGLDEPQTFAGYELLFAHLATFSVTPNNDWRDRLLFVQAKAPDDRVKRLAFAQRVDTIIRRNLWPPPAEPDLGIDIAALADTFEVEWTDGPAEDVVLMDDNDGPWPVIAISDDDRFRSFDPVADRDALGEEAYISAFHDLIEIATDLINEVTAVEENAG